MNITEEYRNKIEKIMEHVSSIDELAKELGIAYSTAERYERFVRNGKKEIKIPKILLLDIETVMMKGYFWYQGEQRISDEQVLEDWNTVAWAAKWLFDTDTMYDVQTPEEAVNRNDKRIMEGIWKLIDEADICIGHNIDRFDIRKINTRCLKYGFIPPSPYRTVDTLKAAKKHFSMSSYKLNAIAKFLGVQGKLHTGFQLWIDCLDGNQEALDKMSEYNIQDVLVLEDVYLKLRPWIKSHPNIALYMDIDCEVCCNCGSADLIDNGEYYTTNVNRYKSFRCNNCGAIAGRKRYSEKESTSKLTPVAR